MGNEHDLWLRGLGVDASPPSGGGGHIFDDLKKKLKRVEEPAKQVEEIIDNLHEIKEKLEEAKEDYELFEELLKKLEEARDAKKLCDAGDPKGITDARDLLVGALEMAADKAEKLHLPPGAKELLQVYAGAVRSTKVVEHSLYKGTFNSALENVESSGDPEAALQAVKEMLCQAEGPRMPEAEFDEMLAQYVKAHPHGKVAAARGASAPQQSAKPTPPAGPQQPARRSDEQVNSEIIETKVEPLRVKWNDAKKEAEEAEPRLKRWEEDLKNKQIAFDRASEHQTQTRNEVDKAQRVLGKAKEKALLPEAKQAIDGIPTLPKAQKLLEATKAEFEKAQQKVEPEKKALEVAQWLVKSAREKLPKAQEAARAAEDDYQSARLGWYRQAQQNTKMDLPDDLQSWMKRSGKS